MHSSIPAVVVGGTLNGLGVARSLSRGNMPVFVVETSRRRAACWSRHGRFVHAPSLEGGALIDTLVDLATRLACRPVLILTSDESVATVSAARERIDRLYRISLPAPAIVATLADKSEFQRFAEREGWRVPRGLVIGNADDCARIDSLRAPLILKPADKTLVLAGIVERTVRADTTAEARDAALRLLGQAPRLIVQEWIDGPETEIFFTLFACDREGRLLGLFPGRKLACSPPLVGTTALCTAAPEVAMELSALTQRFIENVGYRGLGSLEFKRDAKTGEFVFIEPTVGRTDWQEEIATLCGINLPLLTYRAEIGDPLPAPSLAPKAAAWRSSPRFRTPREVKHQGTRTFDGYWRWRDPLPGLYYYAYERGLRRLWQRAARTINPIPTLTPTKET